ncbi:unnamed protein product [Gordionus sp. m RMFG-2023]|uniref:calmodulin-beta-like n=1 Tax=Gordionus sp. m RMFG-2023 TaxID=3053472 RepID=UPI0030DF53B0
MGDGNKSAEQKVLQFKEAFALYDRDADGKILVTELGTVMRCMGQAPTEADLKTYIEEYDTKKTGLIEFGDFLKIVQTHSTNRSFNEAEIREAFRIFDKDGNGFIGAAELRHIMSNLGEKLTEEEVDDLLKMADSNQDGQVKYEDFVTLIMSK